VYQNFYYSKVIRKENPNKMQECIKIFIIPYLYEAQHVSGDTLPIIRSLKLHWQPLVFHMWKVVVRVVGGRCQAQCAHSAWQRPPTARPTTFHVWKIRGCQRSFRLLIMGCVSPETCWASYKYGIINILIHSCILLDFSLRSVLWCTDPQTSNVEVNYRNKLKVSRASCWFLLYGEIKYTDAMSNHSGLLQDYLSLVDLKCAVNYYSPP